jgi:hypothetical protein
MQFTTTSLQKKIFSELIFIIPFVTWHFLQEIRFSYIYHTYATGQTMSFLLSPSYVFKM